jgi:hypothetical protein
MRVMRIIRRAAVLSLLMSWSGVAGAQQGVFTYLEKDRDAPKGKASRELEDMISQQRTAAIARNCARTSFFKNQFAAIYQNPNHPFWQRYPLDPNDAEDIKRTLGYVVANPLPCPLRNRAWEYWDTKFNPATGAPRISVGNVEISPLAGGNVQTHAKRGYLGARIGGSDFIGLFTPDQKSTGESFAMSAKVDLSNALPPLRFGAWDGAMPKSTWLKVGASYSKSDADQSVPTISPGAGNALLVPGPKGGASGFSLPSPGNDVQGARYTFNSKLYSMRLDLGQMCQYTPSFSVGGYGGVGYRRNNVDESFAGSVPGFGRNFGYFTDVDVNEYDVRAGLEVQQKVLLQQGLTLLVSGWAELGLAVMHASGTDRLFFTGFPDSSTGLSKSKSSAAFAAGGSVDFAVGGATIGVAANYEVANNDPVVVRDGTNPSTLDLKRGQAFTLTGGLKLKF